MNRTKETIKEAFWQLLEEKPYSKITVQNIAERSKISRNTFYYHFEDIPALVEYAIDEWLENVVRKEYDVDTPQKCVLAIAQECTVRKSAFLHLYHSVHREEFTDLLSKCVQHIVKFYENSIKDVQNIPEEYRNLILWLYKCQFMGIAMDWLEHNMSYDIVSCYQKVYDYIYPSDFTGMGGVVK